MITELENHLWQSTLLCCVVALMMPMLRRNRAAVRHRLWLAASVKFLIPFSLVVSLAVRMEWRKAPAAVRPRLSVVEQITQPFETPAPAPLLVSVPTAPSRLPGVLFGVWLCGFATQSLAWWRRWRRVRAALRVASPLDLGLPIRAMCTPSRLEPGVFGIFRPFLLLPEGIAEHLTTVQLDSVIAHELCHVRRHDNLAAAVHMLVEALFWFHPLVWWIGVRMLEERERACDEEVLRTAGDPQDYAEGIVAVCKFYLKSPLACMSGVTGSNLKRRVEAIMINRNTDKLSFGRRLMLTAAGMMAVIVPIAGGLLRAPSVRAQQPTGPSEFDAVSVRPSDPNSRNGTVVSFTAGAGLRVVNATVKDLIETGYDVRAFQIVGGPGWVGSTKYDVTGTPDPKGAAASPANNNVRLKVQAMLKDRFRLQLHRESRNEPVYSLVVARGGIKADGLRATDGARRGVNAGKGTMLGEAASMKDLVAKLAKLLDRPVVDNTGLADNYDFKLEWMPDPGASAPEESSLGPSLFTALQQQLGLRLEATKGPVDVLVIDRVERPGEN
jgi:uncharacterized protein (TIGR03435 family)